jgi:hypothetical protein
MLGWQPKGDCWVPYVARLGSSTSLSPRLCERRLGAGLTLGGVEVGIDQIADLLGPLYWRVVTSVVTPPMKKPPARRRLALRLGYRYGDSNPGFRD